MTLRSTPSIEVGITFRQRRNTEYINININISHSLRDVIESHIYHIPNSLPKVFIETMTTHNTPAIPQMEYCTPKLNLLDLPQEIHLLITSHLIYPDALSLKHTNRYFYSFVYTGLHLKVEWLIQRRRLHLDCPGNSCELGSDTRFCRGSVA